MKFDTAANKLFRTVGKPPFMYGTAWKKDATNVLVGQAIAAGFTAIDTAAQPKHYREELVGDALRHAYKAGTVTREDVFVSLYWALFCFDACLIWCLRLILATVEQTI
jgi:diketogulonate reductase-like aldo/keto reductase